MERQREINGPSDIPDTGDSNVRASWPTPTRPLPSFLAGDRRRVVAITSRFLFPTEEAFWNQVERIAYAGVDAFILREKDLSQENYQSYAKRFIGLCELGGTTPVIHSHLRVALEMRQRCIQMPLPLLEKAVDNHAFKLKADVMPYVGTSVHSREDAERTKDLPVSWLIASNIFPTDCKKGLPGRGLKFIWEMKEVRPDLPLIALGGIDEYNAGLALDAGADGVALMSGFMRSDNPERLVQTLRTLM
jgi:thiamine-phosphate pyrophosphorylase